MMPMTSHIRWPVMKLPGSTPDPCKIHTAPTRIAIAPRIKLPIRTALHYAPGLHTSPRECMFTQYRNLTGRVRRPAAHRALGRITMGLVCAYRPHTTPALLRAKARGLIAKAPLDAGLRLRRGLAPQQRLLCRHGRRPRPSPAPAARY